MIPIYQIHPMLVHFPIAILMLTFFCEGLRILYKKEALDAISLWGLILGVGALFLASLSGWIAHQTVPHSSDVYRLIDRHEQLGFLTTGIFCVLLVFKLICNKKKLSNKFLTGLYSLFFLSGMITLLIGGHLGGRLVFEHGVGVQKDMAESPLLKTFDHSNPSSDIKEIFDK